MPTYREFPVGLATRGHLRRLMTAFAPDVVHLASPAWLGHQAGEAARSLGIPVVAVYQTDLIGFAERYPFPGAAGAMRSLTRRVHGPADRTLVPSTASGRQLEELGIERIHRWGRGVDTQLFAPHRRNERVRKELGGGVLVGYVGRLAAEKELELLTHLRDVPGTRLVLVGGGPEEQRLRTLLPEAALLGVRHGEDLASIGRIPRRVRAHRAHRDVLPVCAGGARVRGPGRGAPGRRTGRPGDRGRQRLPLRAGGRCRAPAPGRPPRRERVVAPASWVDGRWPAYATGRGRPSTTSCWVTTWR